MDFPWKEFLASAFLIGAWTAFWKFAIDTFWEVFGSEYIYIVSMLEGEPDERPNVER